MRAASSYYGNLGPFRVCSQALWVTLLCGQYLIPSHLWPWLVSLCLLGWLTSICSSIRECGINHQAFLRSQGEGWRK